MPREQLHICMGRVKIPLSKIIFLQNLHPQVRHVRSYRAEEKHGTSCALKYRSTISVIFLIVLHFIRTHTQENLRKNTVKISKWHFNCCLNLLFD